jgi:hypothetical protein
LLEADESKIVGVNLQSMVRPTIGNLKQEFLNKVTETKAAYQDSLDQMDSLHNACKAAEGKLKIVLDKAFKCQKTLESEQSTHSAKRAVRAREVEAMETKVAGRRDPVALEEQMTAYERQCAELEALRREHEEDNITRMISVQEEIERACALMMAHEEHFRSKLQELDDYWNAKELCSVVLQE